MSETAYRPTPAEVKALRETTQAGMMDCKRALEETGGDMDAAVRLLRERGLAAAGKRAGRGTSEGVVEAYVHAGNKIGVLVEVGCETDFVARTDDFREFARTVALQIAAGRNIQYVSEADVPGELRDSEIDIFRSKAAAEGKPEAMVDRIAEGQWKKALQDIVLLGQPSIRPEHEGRTIEDMRAALSAKLGENVEIKRFARYEIGGA